MAQIQLFGPTESNVTRRRRGAVPGLDSENPFPGNIEQLEGTTGAAFGIIEQIVLKTLDDVRPGPLTLVT